MGIEPILADSQSTVRNLYTNYTVGQQGIEPWFLVCKTNALAIVLQARNFIQII